MVGSVGRCRCNANRRRRDMQHWARAAHLYLHAIYRASSDRRTYAVLAVGDGGRAVVLADIGPPPPRYAALGTGCAPLPSTSIYFCAAGAGAGAEAVPGAGRVPDARPGAVRRLDGGERRSVVGRDPRPPSQRPGPAGALVHRAGSEIIQK